MTTLVAKPPRGELAPPALAVPWLDRELYPFTPRRFDTADGALSYVDEGSGLPVLIVHGTPSWSFEWRQVVARLVGAGRRCIVPDHLGFGLSDKPAHAPLRPEDHAGRLAAFVQALDVKDATLVVHDFGGPIGLPLALSMPSRFRSVVVVNSWMWSNEGDRALRKLDALVRSPLGRFLYLGLNASPRWLVPASFGDRRKLSRDVHRHYLAPFPRWDSRHGLYALARALLGSSAYYDALWRERGALAAQPLRIVWGMKDPAFTARELTRWRTAFPHAEVHEVDHAGHFVAEEAPEVIAAAVLRPPVAASAAHALRT